MLARYLNAPLLLLIWQIAPIEARRDEGGRVRLSIGAGTGGFAFNDFQGYPAGMSCGVPYPAQAPYTEAIPYTSAGAAAEVWARNNLRIWAAIGGVTDNSMERNGDFGAVQVVLEKRHIGIGLGFATLGGLERSLQPSASLSYGSLDRLSIRADYRHPDAAMGLAGGPRIGIGWNQGRSRKAKVLFGISTTPVPDTLRRVGGFVELEFPLGFLTRDAGLSLRGFLGGTHQGNQSKQIGSFFLGGWLQP